MSMSRKKIILDFPLKPMKILILPPWNQKAWTFLLFLILILVPVQFVVIKYLASIMVSSLVKVVR